MRHQLDCSTIVSIERQQSRSFLHRSILPLSQHDPGELLNNDEAYALSHRRIFTEAIPGCRS
ncbi:conserved hypothetical protein [delta proteobacterium NaphS2]|nr:conserved hypothetical protein [delta proteobacterium NaphS2]